MGLCPPPLLCCKPSLPKPNNSLSQPLLRPWLDGRWPSARETRPCQGQTHRAHWTKPSPVLTLSHSGPSFSLSLPPLSLRDLF